VARMTSKRENARKSKSCGRIAVCSILDPCPSSLHPNNVCCQQTTVKAAGLLSETLDSRLNCTAELIHSSDQRIKFNMSSEAGNAQGGGSSINLDQMSLEELNQMRQQEESRLQAFSGRYSQLRAAAARLNASQMAVSELSPASEGKEVMVPLTESVYVPGKIRDPNKLLVEVGTGFFVEKSSKDTNAFLDRKLKLCDANSDNVTKYMQVTQQNIESIQVTMQGKMMEIRARQEGQRHKAAVEG
jgi:prefoldin alpha subunit